MILGVDPGQHGAIVAFNEVTREIDGMLDVDVDFLADELAMCEKIQLVFLQPRMGQRPRPLCFLEHVHSMPTDGHVGAFTFGREFGALKAALRIAGCRVCLVQPALWKAAMGLTSDKSLSRQRAITLFPDAASLFRRKKDDGRAEAALLAVYGERFLVKQPKYQKESDLL